MGHGTDCARTNAKRERKSVTSYPKVVYQAKPSLVNNRSHHFTLARHQSVCNVQHNHSWATSIHICWATLFNAWLALTSHQLPLWWTCDSVHTLCMRTFHTIKFAFAFLGNDHQHVAMMSHASQVLESPQCNIHLADLGGYFHADLDNNCKNALAGQELWNYVYYIERDLTTARVWKTEMLCRYVTVLGGSTSALATYAGSTF